MQKMTYILVPHWHEYDNSGTDRCHLGYSLNFGEMATFCQRIEKCMNCTKVLVLTGEIVSDCYTIEGKR